MSLFWKPKQAEQIHIKPADKDKTVSVVPTDNGDSGTTLPTQSLLPSIPPGDTKQFDTNSAARGYLHSYRQETSVDKPTLSVASVSGILVQPQQRSGLNAAQSNLKTAVDYERPYVNPRLKLVDRYIDEPRPLKAAVVGAGLAGITAGALLPAKVPGINLTIYEKNAELGGTWLENVYPGVRCDIPAHVYQSTFSPKTQWTEKFAKGSEIRDYWQDVARKHNVYDYVKLQHKVLEAEWQPQSANWRLLVRDQRTGTNVVEEVDFLITAIGRFNAWKLPSYPGIESYKGHLRHAQNWDPAFDPTGKRIAVIGNGASAIQLVPNLQPIASRIDHYARSKTWIATSWAGDERTFAPQRYTKDELARFRDPKAYHTFRKEFEDKYWRRLESFFKGTDASKEYREKFSNVMAARLAKKPELVNDMIPDFAPNCRRLTPGPGYLEALCEDNVDYIKNPIERFTETGIVTADGKERAVDAVICATGANSSLAPPFPIKAGGRDLKEEWKSTGPITYQGLATPGFPNLLFIGGAHGSGPSGTVPQAAETQITYYAKLLRKVGREGLKTVVPSEDATQDFIEYADALFATTVLSEDCSSWYNGGKPGGRIHGIWPGSAAHVTLIRREPRWEDWEYTYLSEPNEEGRVNRFQWYFGNGRSKKESIPGSDMTGYLEEGEPDLRALHERWWVFP